MNDGDAFSGTCADEFFDAALQSLSRRMGNVSFAKFLGERSLEDARHSWLTGVNSFISAFPDGTFRGFDTSSGDPVLRFSGGLTLRIDLWRVIVDEPTDDAWQANMTPAQVPIALEAVGYRLWGEPWAESLQTAVATMSAAPRYAWSERSRRWFVQVAPHHGPGASFVSESHARRAAAAYAVGADEVARLFEVWRSGDGP